MNYCSKTSAMRVNRYQLCYVWDSSMHYNLDLRHVTGPGKKLVSCWVFCTSHATGGSDAALSGETLNAFTAVAIAVHEATLVT